MRRGRRHSSALTANSIAEGNTSSLGNAADVDRRKASTPEVTDSADCNGRQHGDSWEELLERWCSPVSDILLDVGSTIEERFVLPTEISAAPALISEGSIGPQNFLMLFCHLFSVLTVLAFAAYSRQLKNIMNGASPLMSEILFCASHLSQVTQEQLGWNLFYSGFLSPDSLDWSTVDGGTGAGNGGSGASGLPGSQAARRQILSATANGGTTVSIGVAQGSGGAGVSVSSVSYISGNLVRYLLGRRTHHLPQQESLRSYVYSSFYSPSAFLVEQTFWFVLMITTMDIVTLQRLAVATFAANVLGWLPLYSIRSLAVVAVACAFVFIQLGPFYEMDDAMMSVMRLRTPLHRVMSAYAASLCLTMLFAETLLLDDVRRLLVHSVFSLPQRIMCLCSDYPVACAVWQRCRWLRDEYFYFIDFFFFFGVMVWLALVMMENACGVSLFGVLGLLMLVPWLLGSGWATSPVRACKDTVVYVGFYIVTAVALAHMVPWSGLAFLSNAVQAAALLIFMAARCGRGKAGGSAYLYMWVLMMGTYLFQRVETGHGTGTTLVLDPHQSTSQASWPNAAHPIQYGHQPNELDTLGFTSKCILNFWHLIGKGVGEEGAQILHFNVVVLGTMLLLPTAVRAVIGERSRASLPIQTATSGVTASAVVRSSAPLGHPTPFSATASTKRDAAVLSTSPSKVEYGAASVPDAPTNDCRAVTPPPSSTLTDTEKTLRSPDNLFALPSLDRTESPAKAVAVKPSNGRNTGKTSGCSGDPTDITSTKAAAPDTIPQHTEVEVTKRETDEETNPVLLSSKEPLATHEPSRKSLQTVIVCDDVEEPTSASGASPLRSHPDAAAEPPVPVGDAAPPPQATAATPVKKSESLTQKAESPQLPVDVVDAPQQESAERNGAVSTIHRSGSTVYSGGIARALEQPVTLAKGTADKEERFSDELLEGSTAENAASTMSHSELSWETVSGSRREAADLSGCRGSSSAMSAAVEALKESRRDRRERRREREREKAKLLRSSASTSSAAGSAPRTQQHENDEEEAPVQKLQLVTPVSKPIVELNGKEAPKAAAVVMGTTAAELSLSQSCAEELQPSTKTSAETTISSPKNCKDDTKGGRAVQDAKIETAAARDVRSTSLDTASRIGLTPPSQNLVGQKGKPSPTSVPLSLKPTGQPPGATVPFQLPKPRYDLAAIGLLPFRTTSTTREAPDGSGRTASAGENQSRAIVAPLSADYREALTKSIRSGSSATAVGRLSTADRSPAACSLPPSLVAAVPIPDTPGGSHSIPHAGKSVEASRAREKTPNHVDSVEARPQETLHWAWRGLQNSRSGTPASPEEKSVKSVADIFKGEEETASREAGKKGAENAIFGQPGESEEADESYDLDRVLNFLKQKVDYSAGGGFYDDDDQCSSAASNEGYRRLPASFFHSETPESSRAPMQSSHCDGIQESMRTEPPSLNAPLSAFSAVMQIHETMPAAVRFQPADPTLSTSPPKFQAVPSAPEWVPMETSVLDDHKNEAAFTNKVSLIPIGGIDVAQPRNPSALHVFSTRPSVASTTNGPAPNSPPPYPSQMSSKTSTQSVASQRLSHEEKRTESNHNSPKEHNARHNRAVNHHQAQRILLSPTGMVQDASLSHSLFTAPSANLSTSQSSALFDAGAGSEAAHHSNPMNAGRVGSEGLNSLANLTSASLHANSPNAQMVMNSSTMGGSSFSVLSANPGSVPLQQHQQQQEPVMMLVRTPDGQMALYPVQYNTPMFMLDNGAVVQPSPSVHYMAASSTLQQQQAVYPTSSVTPGGAITYQISADGTYVIASPLQVPVHLQGATQNATPSQSQPRYK